MRFHLEALKAAVVAVGLAAATPWCSAAPQLYEFTATGPTLNARVVYSLAPDTDPDSHKGRFIDAVYRYDVWLNGALDSSGAPVTDSFQGRLGSAIIGFDADGIGACGRGIGCFTFMFETLRFPIGPNDPFVSLAFDYAGGVITDDALPTNFSAETTSSFFYNGNRQWSVGSVLTQVTAVPEPASAMLAIAGVLCMGLIVALSRRSSTGTQLAGSKPDPSPRRIA